MSKHNPPDKPHDRPSVTNKFPGLADKSVKSISVQRPIHSDEKTVTETNLDKSQTGHTDASPSQDATPDRHQDETVLALPPSPEQRKTTRRRNIIITAIAAVAVLLGGGAVLYFSPLLAIEDIRHEGLELVTQTEAEERTEVLTGRPLPQVGDSKATQLFADNPAVDHVTLRAEPPNGLVVIVNEHTPIAMSPQGKEYVVFSEAGDQLASITSQKAQEFDLPVVASASDVADEDVFNTITEVLGALPDELRDEVKAASGESIDSIELELTSDKTVMWGNNEEADKKARVLEALLNLDDDEAAEIQEYDVSTPDFPVTR